MTTAESLVSFARYSFPASIVEYSLVLGNDPLWKLLKCCSLPRIDFGRICEPPRRTRLLPRRHLERDHALRHQLHRCQFPSLLLERQHRRDFTCP